jgi:biotin carboxyl carrier protein
LRCASPWSPAVGPFGFRLNAQPVAVTYLAYESAKVRIEMDPDAVAPSSGVLRTDDAIVLFDRGDAYSFSTPDYGGGGGATVSGGGALISPMPGRIVSVGAEVGARVDKGQPIVTLEAMKMEHALAAPFAGTVTALSVQPGDQVADGVTLARIEAES